MKTALGCILVVACFTPGVSVPGDQGYIGVQIKNNPDGPGILVVMAVPNSPADMAGLRGTDVILKINGKKLDDLNDLINTVRDTKPGETVVLTLSRDQKEMDLKVKVGKLPPEFGG